MQHSNLTVLLIDDDPDGLLFVCQAFKAIGTTMKIQTVDDGREAIAYMKGEGKYSDRSLYEYPNFVITDLKMPGVDGFGVLEHLRKDVKSAFIPAVVLSGSANNDDITKAYQLGANSYHVKPSAPSALRALVKALCDYWMVCEIPKINTGGQESNSGGAYKLGQRSNPRSYEEKTTTNPFH